MGEKNKTRKNIFNTFQKLVPVSRYFYKKEVAERSEDYTVECINSVKWLAKSSVTGEDIFRYP